MPSGKNWFNFFIANLLIAFFIIYVYYLCQVSAIKSNWPLYRCNPMYMLMADDINENFIYCVQTMQSNFMGYLLQPLTFVTNNLTASMGGAMEDIQNARAMFSKVRTFMSDAVQSIFGVFLNLVIEFQKVTIGIKDIMAKTIGILVSFMYIMDGSIKTMNSTWNGPPGQMVRSLGKCFHSKTKIELINGKIVQFDEVNVNDVLKDGSIVKMVIKLSNTTDRESIYEIKNNGVHGESIYVTGTHYIYDKFIKKYIQIHHYDKATKTDLNTDILYCFITDTHRIQIGNELFWDWEDHLLNPQNK